ncbi:hypothetical protein OR571_19235 [Psychrobacillus sp. NEAU-3TGS]|uniref:hypothetical protein n=1 Tax=Psychrobacillus sp. NEAU-3TGS TaxID=2995412 RepID=UPI002498203C|nr:hypothetical protein [Psychrobacillus sp. NEAU-3TGS]MDI2589173.1 hypothetical protein [Psychrobacillus sp. NEAU-3TGS]
MSLIADILMAIYVVVMIMSSFLYVRHLTKTKKQRKLSTFEYTMYVIIQIAYLLFAISLLISVFVG